MTSRIVADRRAEHSAGVVIERCDPRTCLDEVVGLFQRSGDANSSRHYERYFGETGYGMPHSWVLRAKQSGEVVGLCCVMPRQFRWGAVPVKVGVIGNIVVDNEYRRSLGAISLLRAALSTLSTGEVDVLLGVIREPLTRLSCLLEGQVLGEWEPQALILHSAHLLRSRLGWLGLSMSPAIDLWAAARRFLSQRFPLDFPVEALNDETISQLSLGDWAAPEGQFVEHPSASFLQRFLHASDGKYRVLGLRDPHFGELCGYAVVTIDSGGIHICDCRTDARRLVEAQAILSIYRSWKTKAKTFSVAPLQSSKLAEELQAAGFIAIPSFLRRFRLLLAGFWRPSHPLAREFGQASRWNLFLEANYV